MKEFLMMRSKRFWAGAFSLFLGIFLAGTLQAAQATPTPLPMTRTDMVPGKIPGVPELDTKMAAEDICKKRFPDYTPEPNGACYWRVWGCMTQLEPQLQWLAKQTRHCIPNEGQGYICGLKFIFAMKYHVYHWWHDAMIQKVEDACKEEMDKKGAAHSWIELPAREGEMIESIGY